MPKIRVEIEVPNGNYCDDVDEGFCPLFERDIWGECFCLLFNRKLELDKENDENCKRCDECKQAEVKDEHSSN